MSRVWMITGAGRGLGRAFAEEAVNRGDKVIAGVRKVPQDDPLFQDENVLPVIMDVTDQNAVNAAVKVGVQKFGRIDVLVNNAGFGMSGAFEETSDVELRMIMDTNFFGTANVTRAVIPVMREQKSGMILSVSSQAGTMGFLGSTAYCSSKYAVVGLMDALGMELKGFGIQVSSILPGSFRTDFRDPSSMKFAGGNLSAYDNTSLRDVRDFLTVNNHKQEGDPVKAAAFIYEIVSRGDLPKRIHIGGKCCSQVKEYLMERVAEIDSYIEASSETDSEL